MILSTNRTTVEFQSRLRNLTISGKPELISSPFSLFVVNNSDKLYYGDVTDKTFRITSNSVLMPTGAIIEGHYYSTSDFKKTEVNFGVKPIPFAYYWRRIMPFLGFLSFNSIFFYNRDVIEFKVILIFNLLLGLGVLLVIRKERRRRTALEKKFIAEMDLQ